MLIYKKKLTHLNSGPKLIRPPLKVVCPFTNQHVGQLPKN